MLAAGARLGPYDVVGPLGAGGMGEVWRARDTRLGREVALKSLPAEFAGDPARLSRFEREARLLASLNHPGIAALHGFEQLDGVPLLVMELIEGPTLAERLRQGALPVREALETAVRIAEALQAAHDEGVVHRDLKPSNVKLRPGGRVKILDFGLAKAVENRRPPSSQVATDTCVTTTGAVLGTAPYMSPEQARGEDTDERTDVWAFGCVLYEMLTGTRPFPGPTASEATAAILEREPDWSALPPATPPAVRSVLRHCLQKDRSRRLRSPGDAAIVIEDALRVPSADEVRAQAHSARAWLPAVAAAVAALAGGIAAARYWMSAPSNAPLLHLNLDIPPQIRLPASVLSGNIVALAPDGASLVFQADGGGLYLQRLDGTAPRPIQGAERGVHPFFSPDGRWMGFQQNGKLLKVPVEGGSPRVLAEAASLRGASWADDGTIVYAPVSEGGLSRVSAEGGPAQELTKPDRAVEISHRWPQVLPGGALLYTSYVDTGLAAQSRIMAHSGKAAPKVLVEGATYGRYVPTGHLLYANGGTVFAAPFDVRRLRVTGPAAPVLHDVRMATGAGTGIAFFDFSRTGALVYVIPLPRPRSLALVRIGRDGSVEPLSDPRLGLSEISLSPDGQRLVASVSEPDGSVNLWRYELANRSWTQLTFGQVNAKPVWSPHGDRIAFSSNRSRSFDLFVMAADGGTAQPLAGVSPGWAFPDAWTRDGRTLLYTTADSRTGQDMWELPLDGQGRARPLLVTPQHETGTDVSPSGHWITHQEWNPAGGNAIYVRPYRGPDRRWTVADGSALGVCCPRWSPTGGEIFYATGTLPAIPGATGLQGTRLMAVPVRPAADGVRVGTPRVVFERPKGFRAYDLTPDGRHFVITEYTDEPERLRVVVAPNWFDELRSKVPGGRAWR